jgi:hypothetical protein
MRWKSKLFSRRCLENERSTKMETRTLKLMMLAGLVLAVSGNAIARDRWDGRWDRHDRGHSRVSIVFTAPHTRVLAVVPYHRIYLAPTVVVAPQPVVAAPAPIAPNQIVTVWITNLNGSKSSVALIKCPYNPGFTGPKGEYYPSMPTEEQLHMVYGL